MAVSDPVLKETIQFLQGPFHWARSFLLYCIMFMLPLRMNSSYMFSVPSLCFVVSFTYLAFNRCPQCLPKPLFSISTNLLCYVPYYLHGCFTFLFALVHGFYSFVLCTTLYYDLLQLFLRMPFYPFIPLCCCHTVLPSLHISSQKVASPPQQSPYSLLCHRTPAPLYRPSKIHVQRNEYAAQQRWLVTT